MINRTRHTGSWFETKKAARLAESAKREEVKNPKVQTASAPETPTDMGFLELVNRRLDHVKAYSGKCHYKDHRYLAKRWVKRWGDLNCSQLTPEIVQAFVLERRKVSPHVANMEIRYLRATFNFAKKRGWVQSNPVDGIDFLPVDKRVRYVPHLADIEKVMQLANPETKDYLWVVRETMARVSEVNRMTWDDVSFEGEYVVLYTRKKRGGHLTPRKISMTGKLRDVLTRRYSQRDPTAPWVFWHEYRSTKTGERCRGPYTDRKKFMKTLCRKAGVRYFRFHPLRHAGASVMEQNNVPIGTIQRILGHENRTTTEIYLHSIGQSERDAMSIYERFREKFTHRFTHNKHEEGCGISATP
ncbi:MAG: site-specific integrase [bacterium]